MRRLLACSAALLTLAACGQSGSGATTTTTTSPASTASPPPTTPDAAPPSAGAAPVSPAPTSSVAPGDTPHQRAGLWNVVQEADGQRENSTHCVTPQESQRGLDPSEVGGAGCSESSMTREGDAYVIRATCGAASTTMRLTGDMQSTMRVETSLNMPGQSTQRMVLTGTYSGQPCSGED